MEEGHSPLKYMFEIYTFSFHCYFPVIIFLLVSIKIQG